MGLNLNSFLSTPRKQNTWRESVGFNEKDFVIGIVARLVPVKNHKMLINSMSMLCSVIPDLHLAIIGDGELKEKLIKQAQQLNLSNSIHFCGISKSIEEVYSDLDLLILCSKNEGTPVVIIEALAAGCPVAAVDVGGVREVLGNGKYGRLLPSEPELFTKASTKAISDIKEGKFKEYPTENTRQTIAQTYSVDNLVRNIFELYRL